MALSGPPELLATDPGPVEAPRQDDPRAIFIIGRVPEYGIGGFRVIIRTPRGLAKSPVFSTYDGAALYVRDAIAALRARVSTGHVRLIEPDGRVFRIGLTKV